MLDEQKLKADLKEIHRQTQNAPNPIEMFRPGAQPKIVVQDSPEWVNRREQQKKKLTQAPADAMPLTRVENEPLANVYEFRMLDPDEASKRRVIKGEPEPPTVFKVVADPNRKKWAFYEGPKVLRDGLDQPMKQAARYFDSETDVIRYLRQKCPRNGMAEFYKSPSAVEEWQGDRFGDFIHSEKWGR